MQFKKSIFWTGLLSMWIMGLTGCSGFSEIFLGAPRSTHHNSSVVEYLYPDRTLPMETAAVPRLTLPLRAGVAFVPDDARNTRVITEEEKFALMQKVSEEFATLPFIDSIQLIPSAYLSARGGFPNLDQIRTMYGIDIVALLAYDQSQFSDENFGALTYWTLVGAYIIPGEKNTTHTMMDATVYDIASRKMLFRAPGLSRIHTKAAPIALSGQQRHDRKQGFEMASQDLLVNLQKQLDLFKEKVKDRPAEVILAHRPGYTGGGAVDATGLLFFILMGGLALCARKHT
ncbi:MAG: rhombotarget lipoprotein [Desulfobacteraceae bacterium]|nr:MAG: rhombotarget lipoprotein [Desulfobacteraceae bacterium]